MVENDPLDGEFADSDLLTEKERAALRWQAVQGFNAAPVPPLAARLGIALICHMDARERLCYVGELRLSLELGAHLLSIQKAKKQLRKAGLINWSNPGGPRHTSHFSFNWTALLRYSKQADDAARGAIETAKTMRRHNSHKAVMAMPVHNSRGAVIAPFQKKPISNSITAKSEIHNSQNRIPSQPKPHSITAVGLADITQDIPLSDVAQHITPPQADGGLGSAKDLDKPFVSHPAPQQMEPKGALEEKDPIYPRPVPPRPQEKRKPILQCFYPKLLEELGNVASISVIIGRLDFEQQTEASKLLNMKGKGREAALAFILDQGKQGAPA